MENLDKRLDLFTRLGIGKDRKSMTTRNKNENYGRCPKMDKYLNNRRDDVELKFIYLYVCCARLPNLVVDDTLTCEIWK